MGGSQAKVQLQQLKQKFPMLTLHHIYVLSQFEKSKKQTLSLALLLKVFAQENEKAEQKAKQLKSPKLYHQLREANFNGFVQNLKKIKFYQKIPKVNQERHHAVIGNIASGKTSLINFACGTQLSFGLGETTSQASLVATEHNGKVHIWDSPGVNEDFKFYDQNNLPFFHSADRIFIVYPNSLKNCKEMIIVLHKIKPSQTYLVRSMCDRGQKQKQNKTVEQELKTDMALLEKWNIKLPILGTSAHKGEEYLDNKRFRILLTTNK